jgi:hypothetical protein
MVGLRDIPYFPSVRRYLAIGAERFNEYGQYRIVPNPV